MKKIILSVLSILLGAVMGSRAAAKPLNRRISRLQTMSDKHLSLYIMMNRWVQVKQDGKCMADYLEKHNYKSVAIYGMSYAGERLFDELKNSKILVAYGIDRDADGICADMKIFTPDDQLEKVDTVIVTTIFFIDEIEKILAGKLSCPIISLQEILCDM